jgi:hypothetical protein
MNNSRTILNMALFQLFQGNEDMAWNIQLLDPLFNKLTKKENWINWAKKVIEERKRADVVEMPESYYS